jgi:hypothetical protein
MMLHLNFTSFFINEIPTIDRNFHNLYIFERIWFIKDYFGSRFVKITWSTIGKDMDRNVKGLLCILIWCPFAICKQMSDLLDAIKSH